MLDAAQNPRYLLWAEERLGVKFDPRTVSLLTNLDKDGSILGVVVFSRFFDNRHCELTVVSDGSRRFITKAFAIAVAHYLWCQCNFERVTAIIAVENSRSLNLAEQLGFQVEGRLRRWYRSGDAFILGLLREDCKWLKVINGQPLSAAGP